MSRHLDTIAAPATPAGTGALAILRISGPDTATLAAAALGRRLEARRVVRGEYRDRAGAVVDEVLGTFFAGPHSYTGEDTLEISCHGNPYIVQRILDDLLARGCRVAGPGEFTQRAFLNGRMELSQAEAVMDLIHARSERALAAAHQQLRGALGRRMNALVEQLLGVLARIEAYIDFPDEDLPPEDRGWLEQALGGLATETARLLATSHYGELLRDGLKTVILGAPNVGKSSLLNRLLGRERALVSPEPGTTRDFLEERLIVGPHCIRLIDTAGLNPSPAPLERLGIEKTLEWAAEADLFLLVRDATEPEPPLPPEVAARLAGGGQVLTVLNKIDLLPPPPGGAPVERNSSMLRVSARTGAGFDELTAAIVARADAFQVHVGDEIIAINARHAQALTEARLALAAAQENLRRHGPVELLASDLRTVLAAYGEITGKVDNERMLDQLFASFCIGK
jgi:tRNA modification GTPase